MSSARQSVLLLLVHHNSFDFQFKFFFGAHRRCCCVQMIRAWFKAVTSSSSIGRVLKQIPFVSVSSKFMANSAAAQGKKNLHNPLQRDKKNPYVFARQHDVFLLTFLVPFFNEFFESRGKNRLKNEDVHA